MTNYYLHADFIVAEDNVELFEKKNEEFLSIGGFGRLYDLYDNELTFALKSPAAFDYKGIYALHSGVKHPQFAIDISPTQRPMTVKALRYVHFWRFTHTEDLDIARVMQRCADDKLYSEIIALFLREAQNYVLRVAWGKESEIDPNCNTFVRVIRQFTPATLGKYLFKMRVLLPILEENGWHSLGHFQNITGVLNGVTEFWQPPQEGADGKSMKDALSGVKNERLKALLVNPYWNLPVVDVRESLIRAPYWRQT